MMILPHFQSPLYPAVPQRAPMLMLPAPPERKMLCAPKIAGLLPARVGLPPIEVTPPQSMWVKRLTSKELDALFEEGLGRPPRSVEQMRDELRARGIEDPEPDPFSVLPSTSGPIEIMPPKPCSRYFKRMTDAEIDALFGHVMSSQEFEEKLRKEGQSWRTAGTNSIGEGQP